MALVNNLCKFEGNKQTIFTILKILFDDFYMNILVYGKLFSVCICYYFNCFFKGYKLAKKFLLIVFIVVGGVFYSGCFANKQPLYNIEDSPVQTLENQEITLSLIEKAIIKAGTINHWKMQKVKDGLIVGTLIFRTYIAVIDITYSTSSYSIIYKNSTSLDYDGKNIHKDYNNWIKNLDNSIKSFLRS
jgi:hypothetical protein